MKKLAILILLLFLHGCGAGGGGGDNGALPPPEELPPSYWAKSFGGVGDEKASSIQQTNDGGYIVAGCTTSFGAQDEDFWVVKLDLSGVIEWEKRYERIGEDCANSIQQTNDGGYIVAGISSSENNTDILIMKLNSSGNISWAKTYDKELLDTAYSIQQTNDGGYIVAGYSYSSLNGSDFLVMKLNPNGSISWAKTYDNGVLDIARSIQQTNDGGYIVAGYTNSFGDSGEDFLVMKLNPDGSISWAWTYHNEFFDNAFSIQQTNDGRYIVAGYTNSFGDSGEDFLVMKLNPDGNRVWAKTYGGTDEDFAYSIQQTDNGYIVAGYTKSFGADAKDFWVLKLDLNGVIQWQKTYGGTDEDFAYSIQQTDNGYIVAGYTKSFGADAKDFWVLSLKSDGTVSPTAPPYIGADSSAQVQNATVIAEEVSITIPPIITIIATPINITPIDTTATVYTQASE
jgi:uncharacterized delta-60 repeat protein